MTDRDEKGDEMTDRMSRRFGADMETEDAAEESNQSKESETSKTPMTTKTSKTQEGSKDEQTNITELPSVLMYLPPELKNDLGIRFDELNLQHKREYDEELEKNRDFYPALIRAALSDEKSLEDILLERDDE